MSNPQQMPNNSAVSPLTPEENDQSFPAWTGGHATHTAPEIGPDRNQSILIVPGSPFVVKKGHFTPASTFGSDEESWTRKPHHPTVRIDQLSISEESQSPRPKGPRPKFPWTWQILSILLSVAGLTAVIAVLVSIERRPHLSEWTLSDSSNISQSISANISPNTLIAIFAAISKAALLVAVADGIGQLKWTRFKHRTHLLRDLEVYDQASRGPWGALKLIFTAKHTALLSCFGACITITALAIDPFAQQIISHVSRNVVAQNETASFQIASMYDTGATSDTLAINGANIDARMQGSIFSGIYSLDTPVPVTCSTANCVWPDFTTLAVCSSCKDVTKDTQTECGAVPQPNPNVVACNYTTPSGFNLTASAVVDRHGISNTQLNSTATNYQDSLFNTTLIVSLATVMLPALGQGNSPHELPPAEVTECSIRWCAQAYEEISVNSNALNQTKIRDVLLKPGPAPNNQGAPKVFSGLLPADGETLGPGNNNFRINSMDHASMSNFLSEIFTIARFTENANAKQASLTDISNALLQTKNMSLTVQNLAKSISMRIRTGPNATVAAGQAFREETFIEVQWLWIILPGTSVLCAAMFLGLVIWWSGRAKVPAWKSSSLALLLHDMKGYYGAAKFDRIEEMDNVAKQVSVRLVKGDTDKWAFERM